MLHFVYELGKRKPISSWLEEDNTKLFTLYKSKGACWAYIASKLGNKTENEVKNRFYSTLRRLARKDKIDTEGNSKETKIKAKSELLKYVDMALTLGNSCYSKRGRKRKFEESPKQKNKQEEDKNNEKGEGIQALIMKNSEALKEVENKVCEKGKVTDDSKIIPPLDKFQGVADLMVIQNSLASQLKQTTEELSTIECNYLKNAKHK